MSRIVGGAFGGRRLRMPTGRSTRPTSDRAREGLFSSLGGDLHGRSFLDLFAGSGAVGLEAASRGAAPVVLVESGAAALTALRANVAQLAPTDVLVRAGRVEAYLSGSEITAFDVVFVDPPYATPVDDVLAALCGGWLAQDGVVIVERATRDQVAWPACVAADRSRRYGDTTLWYGRRP